jgi:hypothetical protein
VSETAAAFRERGFALAKNLLGEDEANDLVLELEKLSGRTRASFARLTASGRRRLFSRSAWTLPDGVSKERRFWSLATKPSLIEAVRDVLGSEVCYLQHSDLHVGFSAVTWHRDCVNRSYGIGPDWDESAEPYRLVRIGIYLQTLEESGFALGLIPGSHHVSENDGDFRALEGRLRPWAQARGLITGQDALKGRAEWISAERGDAILFDPRILHSGAPIKGPKFSVFLAFGVPGTHFARHEHYYRVMRRELAYEDLHPEFEAKLHGAGLRPLERGGAPSTGKAFLPSRMHTWIGRAVRSGRGSK